MRILHAFAALVLFFELPVPLYWLILHPPMRFWRKHAATAYWVAGLSSWTIGGILLLMFRKQLFAATPARLWAIVAGLALIGAEVYLFRRVDRELGNRRLVGHVEMTGAGELATTGLYARARHPRYTGMFSAVLGAALLAGTRVLWAVVAVWWVAALAAIRLEERELRLRFGASYDAYRRRVPAFLPFRLWPNEN